jgi:hypothetical protein
VIAAANVRHGKVEPTGIGSRLEAGSPICPEIRFL